MPRKTIGERLRQKRQSSSSGASTSKRRKSTLKDNQRIRIVSMLNPFGESTRKKFYDKYEKYIQKAINNNDPVVREGAMDLLEREVEALKEHYMPLMYFAEWALPEEKVDILFQLSQRRLEKLYDRLGKSRLQSYKHTEPDEQGAFNADEVMKISNILRQTIRETQEKNENIKKKQVKTPKQKREEEEIKNHIARQRQQEENRRLLAQQNQLQNQQRLTDTLAWVKEHIHRWFEPDGLYNQYLSGAIDINIYRDQDVYTGKNLLMMLMHHDHPWEDVIAVYDAYPDAIFHEDIDGQNALYYFYRYPNHQLEILQWYKDYKRVIYKDGLWKYILCNQPKPNMLQTVLKWHNELRSQAVLAWTGTVQTPDTSMFAIQPTLHLRHILGIIMQRLQRRLHTDADYSLHAQRSFERQRDHLLTLDISNYLNNQIDHHKNMYSRFQSKPLHEYTFDYWFVSRHGFHYIIDNEEYRSVLLSTWTGDTYYRYYQNTYKPREEYGKVKFIANVVQWLMIHKAEYQSVHILRKFFTKNSLELPDVPMQCLWHYNLFYNQEEEFTAGFEDDKDDTEEKHTIELWELVKDILDNKAYRPNEKESWRRMLWDTKHRLNLIRRVRENHLNISKRDIENKNTSIDQLEQWEQQCDHIEYQDGWVMTDTDDDTDDDWDSDDGSGTVPMYSQKS